MKSKMADAEVAQTRGMLENEKEESKKNENLKLFKEKKEGVYTYVRTCIYIYIHI